MPRVGQGGLLARCTPRLLIGGVRQVRMGYTIEDIPIPTADASRRFKDRHECTNKSRSTIRPRPNKLPMHWPWRTQKPANDLGPAQKKPPQIWARPKKTRQRIGPCQKKPANDLALAKKNPPTIWPWPKKTRHWPWPKKTRQRFGPGPCPTKPATDLALAQQKPANDLAPVKRHPTIGPRPTNNANELARQKQHHRFGPGQQPANDLVPASRAPAIWRRFGPGRQTTANSAKQNPRRFGPWCSIQYIVCNMYT